MKYIYSTLLLFLWISASAQTIHPDTLSKHVHYLASEELQGRALGTEGKDKAAAYITQQFQQAGLSPYKDSFTQPFDLKFDLAWVKATNIIGVVEGTDPQLKNELIVLGAHYDHLGPKKDKSTFYPGADDNASGVATIIELAKYFSQNKPKRSLIFIAFDAEESGLLGAKHFVDKLTSDEKKQIKAMFSYDMVGMLEANKGLHLKGIAGIKNGKDLAQKHASGINLLDVSGNIEERTDTEPFGAVGIPAIHVYTGSKSPYHKPEDKADLLDYPGMKKVAAFSIELVGELANQWQVEPTPAMQSVQHNPNKIRKPLSIGLSGYFGSGQHLYKDEFFDAKLETAYSVGLFLNYQFTKHWALHLEGLYDRNASRSALGEFKRHSIMVPLNLEWGKFAYVTAGAYFKHHFDGKDGDSKLDFDNTYRKQEWGYNFGIGLKYSHYRIGFNTNRSFQSIFQNGNKVIPTGSYISLGYKF